jgi:hypothetical protein
MKKNILCVIEGANFGGQQLYLYNLFKELRSYDTNDIFNFHLVYLFKESPSEDILNKFNIVFDKVDCLSLPSRSKSYYFRRPLALFNVLYKFVKLIILFRYKFIFSNGFNSALIVSFTRKFIFRFFNYRFVGGDLSRNEPFSFNLIYNIIGLHNTVDLFLTWPEQLDYLKSKGVNAKTIHGIDLIQHVDFNLFMPKNSTILRRSLGISESDIVLGWVGRIDFDPDSMAINETLDLCKYLSIKHPSFSFKFLIIGDGSAKSNLVNKIDSLGIKSFVILLPFQSQEKLVEYYNLIDFEILLDEDPQGGSHLREAMACGRVALSVNGDSGVQSRLIEHLVTGLLVKPENRIVESAQLIISLSTKQRENIGNRGRDFMSRFSYSNQAKELFSKMIDELNGK